MINIARQTDRKIQWDPEKERIVGDRQANERVNRERRKGYELPDHV